jgi:hypothetical protein
VCACVYMYIPHLSKYTQTHKDLVFTQNTGSLLLWFPFSIRKSYSLQSWEIMKSWSLLILFFSFFIIFICAYNVWVISPHSPTPSLTLLTLPSPPYPLATRQKLFCPYLYSCWRESISKNRKDQGFMLVEIRRAIQGVTPFAFLYMCVTF